MKNYIKKVISKKDFIKTIKQTVKDFIAFFEAKNTVNIEKSNKPSWCISVETKKDGQFTLYYSYKEFIKIYGEFSYLEQMLKVQSLTKNQLKNHFHLFKLFDKTPILKPITVLRVG